MRQLTAVESHEAVRQQCCPMMQLTAVESHEAVDSSVVP